MSMEPCPQCGREWQAGQEVCPNCGFRRPPAEAGFRTGPIGTRPPPAMPPQPATTSPAQPGARFPAAPPPPPLPAPSPPPPPAPPPGPPPAAPPSAAAAAPPASGFGASAPPQQESPVLRAPAWGGTTAERPKSVVRPLALIGAIGIILGGPLPWSKFNFDAAGYNLQLKFLFTGHRLDLVHDPTNPGFTFASIGVVLIVIGVIALILSFIPAMHLIRRLAGLVAILVVVAFVIRVLVGDFNESLGGLFKDLGPGAYTAFVGGILALVG